MKTILVSGTCMLFFCYQENPAEINTHQPSLITPPVTLKTESFPNNSWSWFLQHLPAKQGTVVDYRGKPVRDQYKAAAVLDFDIGSKDLQQCADAIIRLRSEYLYAAGKSNAIRFHFTNGDIYSFQDYCKGLRPLPAGNTLKYTWTGTPTHATHAALRKYLDIVYTYAGTRSLWRDMQPAKIITIGTVILQPGSPGHCSIVVDAAITPSGQPVYKLAEGFMPAQSIYILRNPKDGTAWYRIPDRGPFETASYHFESFRLYNFQDADD